MKTRAFSPNSCIFLFGIFSFYLWITVIWIRYFMMGILLETVVSIPELSNFTCWRLQIFSWQFFSDCASIWQTLRAQVLQIFRWQFSVLRFHMSNATGSLSQRCCQCTETLSAPFTHAHCRCVFGASVAMMLFHHYQPSVDRSGVKSEMELRLHQYNLMPYCD